MNLRTVNFCPPPFTPPTSDPPIFLTTLFSNTLSQGCTVSGHQVAQATKFCIVAHLVF